MTIEEFELEPGETVMRTVRRHWLVFLLELMPFFIAAIIPFLIPSFIAFIAENLPSSATAFAPTIDLSQGAVRLALGLWWLFLWTGAFTVFTHAYLDLWVITSTRIANIRQEGFFHRRVESFLLIRVQDVTTEVRGIIPTLIGFGSVRVETAGEASRMFRMKGLPDPEGIRDLIIREIALIHDKAR